MMPLGNYMSHLPKHSGTSQTPYQKSLLPLENYNSINPNPSISFETRPGVELIGNEPVSQFASPPTSEPSPSPLSTFNAEKFDQVPSYDTDNVQTALELSNDETLYNENEETRLRHALQNIIRLKRFLHSAPIQFAPAQFDRVDIIRQFRLPTDEQISCVRWNQLFCITGTDIVRCLVYRFSLFGREVINRKKFEEGVFSDLRNLKINVDSILESPKSELLEFLYRSHCVRTKKKQKIFFWHSVQHDRLFVDALERELKRESSVKSSMIPSKSSQKENSSVSNGSKLSTASASNVTATVARREPALSFKYNINMPLSEQIPESTKGMSETLASLVREIMSSIKDPKAVKHTATQALPTTPHNNPTYYTPRRGDQYPVTPLQIPHKISSSYMEVFNDWSKDVSRRPDITETQMLPTPQSINGKLDFKGNIESGSQAALHNGSCFESHYEPSINLQLAGNHRSAWPELEADGERSVDFTDFPLDVLVKEDQCYQRYASDPNQSFETRYTEYAYANRPAVSYESVVPYNRETRSSGPLGSPFHTTTSLSSKVIPTSKSFYQQASLPAPLSPDLGEFLSLDTLDWHPQNMNKSYYSDTGMPRTPHTLSYQCNTPVRVTKRANRKKLAQNGLYRLQCSFNQF